MYIRISYGCFSLQRWGSQSSPQPTYLFSTLLDLNRNRLNQAEPPGGVGLNDLLFQTKINDPEAVKNKHIHYEYHKHHC